MPDVIKKLTEAEKDARDFGFSYPSPTLIVAQIKEECDEVLDAVKQNESRDRVQEEIGDLIHAAAALCYHMGFDIHDTIDQAVDKFSSRMTRLKVVTKEEGLSNLVDQELETLIKLWKKAK